MKADLTITLQGGCSWPLEKVAETIREALVSLELTATVIPPKVLSDEWAFGWDGFPGTETVAIMVDPEGHSKDGRQV